MREIGNPVFLVAGSRTPIGSFGRSLRSVEVDKLAAHAMKSAVQRAKISSADVDSIILGHGYQSTYTPNTARVAALLAGFPATIPAMTIQRQCGSGMQAALIGAGEIALGQSEIVLAGGCESMSTVPYLLAGKWRWQGFIAKNFAKVVRLGPRPVALGVLDNGLAPTPLVWDLKSIYMAGTAQCLSDSYNISRQEADQYALRSQELATEAIKSGRFQREIDPIEVPGRGLFINDEHPRTTSMEKLSALSPVLKTRSITAGNSSGINDGACALVLASGKKVEELGVKPLAKIIDSSVVGFAPEQMGASPVIAINRLLARHKLTVKDIDLFEINEAFAAQYLACEKLLGLDRQKVNVNGGAIALGHPIGMSGARLLLTLAYELQARGLKRGIASLCIGGGMAIAALIESAV